MKKQHSAVALRLLVIGPIPPPLGGMAAQTQQLIELLRERSGSNDETKVNVSFLATNLEYKPSWVARLKGVRAIVRLFSYVIALLRTMPKVDVVHLMSNSGWAWHLFSTPALLVARLYRKPVVVNYRGGYAEDFFESSWHLVKPNLKYAQSIVVPNPYLQKVFANYSVKADVIPNILDRELFSPAEHASGERGNNAIERGGSEEQNPVIVVTRNLEEIYDIPLAVRAFAKVKEHWPGAKLVIAGEGPALSDVERVIETCELTDSVSLKGRLSRIEIADLYRSADICLNTSKVDNSPNSLIEALSCGVPVVSSSAGGIPYLLEDGENGMVVDGRDPDTYAQKIKDILANDTLRRKLIDNGLLTADNFEQGAVLAKWLKKYLQAWQESRRWQVGTGSPSRSLRTRAIASALFPLHEVAKKHHSVSLLKDLERSQWYERERLQGLINFRLQHFMRDIYENVPYYREVMDNAGVRPEYIQQPEDLAKLPTLGKNEIRENLDRLKSDQAGKLVKYNTGGSSGQPLIFFMGMDRVSHDVASKWRATRWWHVDIGDPEIVLWGSPIELGGQDRVKQIRDKLFRTKLISAFDLNESSITETLETIYKDRPPMLFGYPSVFALLAKEARERQMLFNKGDIKVIFVTSEKLYDHQRQLIEEVFQAPVANGYGGRDAGFIAHQCPEGSLHISAEDIIVEILDKNGKTLPPGESGEITVTHMRTSDFPFVRYRTGDVGKLSDKPCACGRSLPVLAEVEGRSTDFIKAKDGTLMHGLALIYHVREAPGVKNFKISQESLDKTVLFLEIDRSEFSQASQAQISEAFKKRLGAEVTVDIKIVDKISPEKSGKFRYVVSKVS